MFRGASITPAVASLYSPLKAPIRAFLLQEPTYGRARNVRNTAASNNGENFQVTSVQFEPTRNQMEPLEETKGHTVPSGVSYGLL